MAISEELRLDLSQAQAQIDDLERQLDSLIQPIDIPVNVQTTAALDDLRRDIQATDAQDVDVDVDVDGLGQADDELGDFNRELRRTEDELEDVTREADRTSDAVLRVGTRGASVFSNLRGSLAGVAAGFLAFQGLQEVTRFFSESITAASDLEQSIGGVQAIFGESSDVVLEFGESAAQSVGLAQSSFNQLSAQLGGQLQAFGFSIDESAENTAELIELGADLAATYGGPVSQAVEAIGSLLRGERNPIERYGVALNEATIQARALDDGLAATTSELTLQDKAVASLSLLYEQTTGAQGQFAREADTTAGALERIRAQFGDASAAIGEALVPAFNRALEVLPALIEALENGLVPALAGVSSASSNIDAEGIIGFVSGLPQAFGTVVSQSSAAGEAVGNALQVFNDLVQLNFAEVGTQFSQLGDDIQRFGEAGVENEAIQNLIQTLVRGVDPAQALGATLVTLGEDVAGLTVESFEDLATQLVAMSDAAGITEPDLRRLAENVEEFGEEAGFSSEGIEILVGLLLDLAQDKGIEAQIERDVAGLLNLAEAAREAEQPIERSAEAAEEFAQRVGAIRADQFAEELGGIAESFSRLPDGLDAAAAALRDEEGEIFTDFTDFLNDLDDELERRAQFRDAVATLEALGFTNLADVAREEGLDILPALLDGLENPAELAEAEEKLATDLREVAEGGRQAMLDVLTEELDLTIPTNATIAIQSLVATGIDTADAQAVVGDAIERDLGGIGNAASDRGTSQNQGGDVTLNVTQNFEAETVPTTETARAAQSLNAIIKGFG